jgi:hypothetical protein
MDLPIAEVASTAEPDDPAKPGVDSTPDLAPYFGSVPQTSELLYYAVAGFEIPSLPALPPENSQARGDLVRTVLYRFRSYVSELHEAGGRRSIALQFAAYPKQATFGARVRCYVLCRSAQPDKAKAEADCVEFAEQAMRTFPQEGIFAYGQPRRLSEGELRAASLAAAEGDDAGPLDIVEIRKHEESMPIGSQPSLHYVPHRFWADQNRDSWLSIIETLAQAQHPTAVRIEIEPVRLGPGQGLEFIALAGRWFTVINEDLNRKASQGEQVRTDGVVTEEMMRQEIVSIAASNAATISYVRRGRHIYERLTTFSDTAFNMRVTLAARGTLPDAIVGSVRSALSMPPADDPEAAIGWLRPDVVRPDAAEISDAADSFRFLAQTRWGRSPRNVAHDYKVDLRGVATPDEVVSLFHVPIYDRPGQTSALSTAEAPFVIPPETLVVKPEKPPEPGKPPETPKRIMIGYMYQRERLLAPAGEDRKGHPFFVTMNDLMKPSLLVGAPGSGKTNLAFSMLIQLWRDHKVPFLVLDPSTGQEFRMLLRDPSLEKDLVVYTVGDPDECPLQFNPFSVPPGVTVRNHTTRILAAFRAAFQMFDPVPAIYEGALERIYTDPRYTGGAPVMRMEQKGDLHSPAPTLASLAHAIRDEVNEKAVSLYEGSKESIGVIRGASTIRVNAIGKKIGHIINVEGNNGEFMQKLLQRPVVIELGGLGDSSNISLVMAFLLTQLAGHIEYAFRVDEDRQNIMFIEEAHRLLGGGEAEGAEGKSAEDLNQMLAEVRKFGQGILVMDQRPSSLVGGVLDNAYIKILTRLSDRPGFDRLASELNLNEAQQRYARTRLKTGDAILLDRDAGQPVLMRSEDAKSKLEKDRISPDEMREKMRANAKAAGLEPPDAAPYVEPDFAKEADAGAKADATSKEWIAASMKAALDGLLEEYLQNPHVFHAINNALAAAADPQAAMAALGPVMSEQAEPFDTLTDLLWDKLKWALVGRIVEDRYPKALQDQVREQRAAAPAGPRPPRAPIGPAAASAAPAALPGSAVGRALAPPLERFRESLERLAAEGKSAPEVWWSVQDRIAQEPPKRDSAVRIADKKLGAQRAAFHDGASALWREVVEAIVDLIGSEPLSEETAKRVAERARALQEQAAK